MNAGASSIATRYRSIAARCRTIGSAFNNLGLWQAIYYYFQRLMNRNLASGQSFQVFSKRARHPLLCRAKTSDLDVFGQMFVQREYRCLDDLTDARLIIDCGANVGFSSAYFLTRFQQCSVICIEPDPGNFQALQTNLKAYKGRVTALHSAVWSRKTGLVLSETPFGDGREWAQTVRESGADETPTITAVDIGSLIRESGCNRVSILKIDIEGAEEVVFSSNHAEWLDKIDNLVIELHGERREKLFHQAIAGQDFVVTRCDDLTVCRRTI